MTAVLEQLKKEGHTVNEDDLQHLWLTRFEHINGLAGFLTLKDGK